MWQERSQHSNNRVSILNNEGMMQIKFGDFVQALKIFHRALLFSTKRPPLIERELERSLEQCDTSFQRDGESVQTQTSVTSEDYYMRGEEKNNGETYHLPINFEEGMFLFKDPVHIPTNENLDGEIVKACLLYNIGIAHSLLKENEEAELHFSKVLSVISVRHSILEIHGEFASFESFQGPTPLFVLHNIGHVQFQSHRYEDAMRTYRKMLLQTNSFVIRGLTADSKYDFNLNVSTALNCLGVTLYYMVISQQSTEGNQDLEEARKILNQALAMRKRVGHGHDLETAAINNNLGRVHFLGGFLNKAQTHYEMAYNIRKLFLEEDHVDIAAVLYNMGQLHRRHGKVQKGLQLYYRCLNILSNVVGSHQFVTNLLLEIEEISIDLERSNAEYYSLPPFETKVSDHGQNNAPQKIEIFNCIGNKQNLPAKEISSVYVPHPNTCFKKQKIKVTERGGLLNRRKNVLTNIPLIKSSQ